MAAINRIWLLGCAVCMMYGLVCGQDSIPPNRLYSSLIPDSVNVIQSDSVLNSFFQKLLELENGSRDRIQIVHIGDSHIQADWITGTIRKELQRKYGNAGRGLVFPYKVARSNSPTDVYSYSNRKWTYYRNLHHQDQYEIGLCGYVIATQDSTAILKISLNDKSNMGYDFNKMTFLHPIGNEYYEFLLSTSERRDILEETTIQQQAVYYTVQSGDYLGKIADKYHVSVEHIRNMNGLQSDMIYPNQRLAVQQLVYSDTILPEENFITLERVCCSDSACTVVTLDTTLQYAFMRNIKGLPGHSMMQWDGIVLEHSDSSGILYHMIGVNGAMYSHYNKQERFFEQLDVLQPDLIVVSLGTNEALNSRTNESILRKDLSTFYGQIQASAGNVPVIISTPPDNSKRSSNAKSIAETLRAFALENGFSIHDIHTILGGQGSHYSLRLKGFASTDRVHFFKEGYEMQGQLFHDALLKAFESYKLQIRE